MTHLAHLFGAAAALFATVAASSEIGSMAAINRDVLGTRPQEDARRLFVRDRVILDERVATSANSGGQVMFLDQTTLTLTPNSDIILDRYVFDPNDNSGDLSVTVLKGAMRLIGGKITKTGVARIRTPSVTIGIRGGIGNVTVGEDGSTEYMHIAGISSTLTTGGNETITITREGGTARVAAPAGGPQAFIDAAVAESGGDEGAGDDGAGDEGGDESADAPGGADDAPEGGAGQTAAEGAGETPEQGAAQAGADGQSGGGEETPQIVYLGVATPEIVDATMGPRAGSPTTETLDVRIEASIQEGVAQIQQEVSAVPGATVAPPVSTTGEQQADSFSPEPVQLDAEPAEDFTENEVDMATEAEAEAQEIVQELNAVSFAGDWSATAGLLNGSFAATEDNLAFRMQYSLLDQRGFITVQLPEATSADGLDLTTFDGVAIRGDRFIVLGDDARDLVADSERLTLLGGDADGTALIISADDVANGAVFIDYDGAGLQQLQFVDGEILDIKGDRLTTEEVRTVLDALEIQLRRNED